MRRNGPFVPGGGRAPGDERGQLRDQIAIRADRRQQILELQRPRPRVVGQCDGPAGEPFETEFPPASPTRPRAEPAKHAAIGVALQCVRYDVNGSLRHNRERQA